MTPRTKLLLSSKEIEKRIRANSVALDSSESHSIFVDGLVGFVQRHCGDLLQSLAEDMHEMQKHQMTISTPGESQKGYYAGSTQMILHVKSLLPLLTKNHD